MVEVTVLDGGASSARRVAILFKGLCPENVPVKHVCWRGLHWWCWCLEHGIPRTNCKLTSWLIRVMLVNHSNSPTLRIISPSNGRV